MSSNSLKVVIVGGGFSGVAAAVECKLRGMHVTLVETYPTSRTQGDVLDFLPNGGRIFGVWDNGKIGKKLLDICVNTGKTLDFYSPKDELLSQEPWNLHPHHYEYQYAGHRGEMHQVLFDYAVEVGVDVRLGVPVTKYIDGETGPVGVELKNGEQFLGDVVLAADGPRSLARTQVLGLPDNKVNSGYAIYRAFYELTDEQLANPHFANICNENEDRAMMWVGRDIHGFMYTWRKARYEFFQSSWMKVRVD